MASIGTNVRHAAINQSGAATTTLVADPGDGLAIVVLGIVLSSDTTGTALFQDGAATALAGEVNLLAGSPLVVGFSGVPVLRVTASESLQLVTSQECNGWIAYTIDTA